METASNDQPSVASRTSSTMRAAVRLGPDGTLTGVRRPVASSLTFDPPMSMTRIFTSGRITAPLPRRNRSSAERFAPHAHVAQVVRMRPHFLAFRRVLPGGMIVLVSLAVADDGQVRGILQVERRRDPTRQLFGTAPLIAEATGPTQQDVLRQLRELAENDAEVAARMAEWAAAHPSPPRDRFER